MCTALAAAKPPLFASPLDSIRFHRAKIFQTSGSIGVFLFDEIRGIQKLFEKIVPVAHIDIILDRMKCKVISFKAKIESEASASAYLRKSGYNTLVEGDCSRLWKIADFKGLIVKKSTTSGHYVFEFEGQTIPITGQDLFIFHAHFLFSLKATLSHYPSSHPHHILTRYTQLFPFGIAALGDSSDPATPQLVTVQKIHRLQKQFFSHLDFFEAKLNSEKYSGQSIVILHLDSESVTGAASTKKDTFIFKKIGSDHALIIIPNDCPYWSGSYKVAQFGLFILNRVQPCIINICDDEIDFDQEILVRHHPLSSANPSIPATLAHWKTAKQGVFVSEFACYGNLYDFLSKKTALTQAQRSSLCLSLLDRFIATDHFLHKDIKKANLLVQRNAGKGFEILINDLGSSALKQAALSTVIEKAIQAEKVKQITTNSYLLSPEMIEIFYHQTRKNEISKAIKEAAKTGIELSEEKIALIPGLWGCDQLVVVDEESPLEPHLRLTEAHWEKSAVFTLGQILFEILFGFDLYEKLYDPTELDAKYPYAGQPLIKLKADPLARAYLECSAFIDEEELGVIKEVYEAGHAYVLCLQEQLMEELSKKEGEEAEAKHKLLEYPKRLVDALADAEFLSILDHELIMLGTFEHIDRILNKAYYAMNREKNATHWAELAKFIYTSDIDIDAAVPATASNINLRRRLAVIRQMLDKNPTTRISLTSAKEALKALDQHYPL